MKFISVKRKPNQEEGFQPKKVNELVKDRLTVSDEMTPATEAVSNMSKAISKCYITQVVCERKHAELTCHKAFFKSL